MIRKKKTLLLLCCALLVSAAVGVTACTEESKTPQEMGYTVKVTYDFNGGSFNGEESMDFYYKENSPALRPGDNSVLGEIVYPGYYLSGWLVSEGRGEDAVPTGEYWDFDSDRVEADIVLVAEWTKNPYVEVVYLDMEGNRLDLPAGRSEPSSGSGTVILRDAEVDGYTFYGYFLDEDCTQPFDHGKDSVSVVYDPDSPDYHKTVYAKLLDGEWFIMRSTNDFDLLSAHASDQIYLDADLDLTNLVGRPGTWSGLTSFSGVFEGNGHTISNFTTTLRQSGGRTNYGLFGELGENAVIRGVRFENIELSLSISSNASVNYGFLCGYAGSGASVSEVSFENCSLRLNRTGGGKNAEVTIDASGVFGDKHESASVPSTGQIDRQDN